MSYQSLAFREDGTFKILQLTDVHWVDGSEKDQQTLALMRRIIETEQPDFIAVTGDLVYGELNLSQLPAALAPVIQSGIPWTYVFGNHDAEWGHSREELCEGAMKLPGCMMQRGDPQVDGVGNHVILVRDKQGKLHWSLYLLDSGSYNANESVGGYDFIHRSQIDWYIRTNRELAGTEGAHSALSFFHMALPEYNDVWDFTPCYGEKNEECGCPEQNSGMFSAMLEMGNMRAVFVGHDHICDYTGTLFGIDLCYGRCSGYNTYGMDGFQKGARLIVLREDKPGGYESYMRLEDGTRLVHTQPHEPVGHGPKRHEEE